MSPYLSDLSIFPANFIISFFFTDSSGKISLHIKITLLLSMYLLMNAWVGSIPWLLCITQQLTWICSYLGKYIYSPVAICPGVVWVSHTVALFLICLGTFTPFSTVAESICVPTNCSIFCASLPKLSLPFF